MAVLYDPIVLTVREVELAGGNPADWWQYGLQMRREIAVRAMGARGDQRLALLLLQGNPNLTDIQMVRG